MRVFAWSIALLLIAASAVVVWQNAPFPCKDPIPYGLGSFDARFGIAEKEFLREIAAAEKVWESIAGKNLFVFVPDAPFKINLVFDERQEQTIAEQKLEASLNKTKDTQQTLLEQNNAALALYKKALEGYDRALASFEARLKRYNGDVEKWNKAGGAPPAEYERLQSEANILKDSQKKLDALREKVNALADTVNQFSKEQVRVVDRYNSQVEGYVNHYGATRDFDQGDYVRTSINIYQFDDRARLRLVLAHELGHALGIGHVDDPTAIMYYLMAEQDAEALRATPVDQTALQDACKVSPHNILQRVIIQYQLAAEK